MKQLTKAAIMKYLKNKKCVFYKQRNEESNKHNLDGIFESDIAIKTIENIINFIEQEDFRLKVKYDK
jgi:hypothetical protein